VIELFDDSGAVFALDGNGCGLIAGAVGTVSEFVGSVDNGGDWLVLEVVAAGLACFTLLTFQLLRGDMASRENMQVVNDARHGLVDAASSTRGGSKRDDGDAERRRRELTQGCRDAETQKNRCEEPTGLLKGLENSGRVRNSGDS